MTTPQEIREKVFEKAVFNGYDIASVDDFIDTLAADIATLQKENSSLKAKMKVLVDKIEEYRSNESALNQAMLSAEKLSVQIESDARARAAALVNDAEAKAASVVGGLDERVAQEEARLQAAKITTAKFLDSVMTMCKGQLEHLEAISVASGNELRIEVSKENTRIQKERNEIDSTHIAEPDPLEAGNTQVFSFSKDI